MGIRFVHLQMGKRRNQAVNCWTIIVNRDVKVKVECYSMQRTTLIPKDRDRNTMETKKRKWLRVEVSCGTDAVDLVAAEIAEGFKVGVEVAERSVRFYLEEGAFDAGWESKLRSILGDLKDWWYPEAEMTYSCFSLPEEDWGALWKEHFKPIRVGEHFIISPTWERVKPGGADLLILIDPGQAFGTGHHETTRLCLEWLEEWVRGRRSLSPSSLLDVGTGSGILAIASVLMEFDPVIAVDTDPEAIRVAKENAGLNRMAERIQFHEGTVSNVPGQYDIVLANIQALPLVEMAPDFARRRKSQGRIVLSGILFEQKELIISTYEKEGLKLLSEKTAGEWCLLAFGD